MPYIETLKDIASAVSFVWLGVRKYKNSKAEAEAKNAEARRIKHKEDLQKVIKTLLVS